MNPKQVSAWLDDLPKQREVHNITHLMYVTTFLLMPNDTQQLVCQELLKKCNKSIDLSSQFYITSYISSNSKFFEKFRIWNLSHMFHNPAPCDFLLFPKIKEKLCDLSFNSNLWKTKCGSDSRFIAFCYDNWFKG